MKKFRLSLVFGLLVLATLLGFFAQAQKRNNDTTRPDGITLTDLGVTDAQKVKLEALWKLKRQKHIQSVKDLKTLNRLAKDSVVSTTAIRETLDKFRHARRKQEQAIEVAEDELIKTLPPRAQLHLTIMGILDNGLPRRNLALSQRGKKQGASQNRDDAESEKRKK